MPANDLSIYQLDAKTWWDDRHGPMAPLHWLTPARFDYFQSVAGSLAEKRVLDIGCGGGLLSERFAAAGAHVLGVDLVWSCVTAAGLHGLQNGLANHYAQMSAEHLALADRSFDIVVAADVLEHVRDLRKVLGEVSRVLREGGIFLFDTINRNWLARWILIELGERILGVVPRGAHDWRKFIKPSELRHDLHIAGMQLEQVTGLGPVSYWGGRIRFGQLPVTWLSYMGWARKVPAVPERL